MKQKAIIFDLDGVLIDSSKRFKRIDLEALESQDKEKFVKSLEWYNSDCRGDQVIDLGVDLLDWMVKFYNIDKVFLITARGAGGYESTLQFLKDENIWEHNFELIMQPEDLSNFEFSSQIDHATFKKLEAIKIMNHYEIVYAVDDSEYNVNAYASLKIPTIKFILPLGRLLV
jgi:FMN phosphatase YigB (HAD superfamily)